MLEEYQQQTQEVADGLHHGYDQLEELRTRLFENYPEEERTFRMGRAMDALGQASQLMLQAYQRLTQIEWPTEDRPR